MAVPLGRLADRWSRRGTIFWGTLLFSGATFASGLTRGFGGLFAARMAVGVGEATLAPAGYSLMGDYMRPKRLALAVSLFVGSSYVGSGIALISVGGVMAWLATTEIVLPLIGTRPDWQLAFIFAAVPSGLFALLMLSVREPPRTGTTDDAPSVPLSEIGAFLKRRVRLFGPLYLGLPILAAANFGLQAWTPAFFMRTYDVTPVEVGAVFGTMVIALSLAGVVTGGWVADRLLAKGYGDANLRVPFYAALAATGFMIAFPLAGDTRLSFLLLAPVLFFGAMPFGAGTAAIPRLAPNRMRGQLTAFYLLAANLIGGGVGPWAVAAFTDFALGDPQELRISLSVVGGMFFAIGAAAMRLGMHALARRPLS